MHRSRLALDVDHHSRPSGSASDIGAYELGALFRDDFESGLLDLWSLVRP